MFDLREYEIDVDTVHRNAAPSVLYQKAFLHEARATLSDTGALIAYSGDKTGRSPKDKRVVRHSCIVRRRLVGYRQYRSRRPDFLRESRARH